MDTLLYAGSFDPVTRGHMDVIRRTAALCSQLVVAVMHNPEKHGFLSVPMRVELLETATCGSSRTAGCWSIARTRSGRRRSFEGCGRWAILKANTRWRR